MVREDIMEHMIVAQPQPIITIKEEATTRVLTTKV